MKILVDPKYDPREQSEILGSTPLADGVTCSKFLGSRGSRTNFDRLYNNSFDGPADRNEIVNYLYVQTQIYKMAVNSDNFIDHRIIVSDGVYEPTPYFVDGTYSGERPTSGSINEYRRTGKAIGYQIIDKKGKSDPVASFDLAVFWKDYANYDKLILDYDTFNVDGSVTGTIFIVLPDISSLDDDVKYAGKIETVYNGQSQSKSDLLEILQ